MGNIFLVSSFMRLGLHTVVHFFPNVWLGARLIGEVALCYRMWLSRFNLFHYIKEDWLKSG